MENNSDKNEKTQEEFSGKQWKDGFGEYDYSNQKNNQNKVVQENTASENWNDGYEQNGQNYDSKKENETFFNPYVNPQVVRPNINNTTPPPQTNRGNTNNFVPPQPNRVNTNNFVPPQPNRVNTNNFVPPQPNRVNTNNFVPPQPNRVNTNNFVPPQTNRGNTNNFVPPQPNRVNTNSFVPPQPNRVNTNNFVSPQPNRGNTNNFVPPQPNMRNVNNFIPPQPYMYIKKFYDKTDKLFSIFATILGFLFILNIGAVFFRFGIGATIFSVAELAVSYIFLVKKHIKIDVLHNISFAFLLLLSVPFTIYSNRLINVVNFFIIMFGVIYWVYSAGGKERKHHGNMFIEFIVATFGYPFMNYGSMFGAMFKKEKSKKLGNIKWIVLGIVIAIPIVCIVSYLLLEGDEMFKAMFSMIFDNFIAKIFKYLFYVILGLPLAMAIFSAWYTKSTEDNLVKLNTQQPYLKTYTYIAPPVLIYSIIIPVCVVYFLYLISQVSYFITFIADNLLPKDYTIVDYARNGFFELCIVAVINIIIIILILAFTKRPNNQKPLGLKIITIMMSAFTLVFIGTAIYKMATYIDNYGYTPLRINTSVFMLFLFVIFAIIIIDQFVPKMNLPLIVLTVTMVFVGVYNVIDTDAIIARENIRLYQQGKIDWMGSRVIRTLDDSAYEYLVEFAEGGSIGLDDYEKYRLDGALRDRYEQLNIEENIMSFNVSRYRIRNILKDYCNNNEKVPYARSKDRDYSYDYDDYYDYYDYDDYDNYL